MNNDQKRILLIKVSDMIRQIIMFVNNIFKSKHTDIQTHIKL